MTTEKLVTAVVKALRADEELFALTHDMFFTDIMEDRFDFIMSELCDKWERFDHSSFIAGETLKEQITGINLYVRLSLAFGLTWGEIYVTDMVSDGLAADMSWTVGIFNAILFLIRAEDDDIDPIVIKLLRHFAQCKDKLIRVEAAKMLNEIGLSTQVSQYLN